MVPLVDYFFFSCWPYSPRSSSANSGASLPDLQHRNWSGQPIQSYHPGQAEVTRQLLSSPWRSLCPALWHFVSFCPFPNLVLQSFWWVYAFPNFFQQILFPLCWTICFCCLRVLTDTSPFSLLQVASQDTLLGQEVMKLIMTSFLKKWNNKIKKKISKAHYLE